MIGAAALSISIAIAGGLWPFGGGEQAAERERAGPTIRTLKSREVHVNAESPAVDSVAQAMDQYRRFLALDAGSADMRAEALRRLADLNLDAGVSAESEAEVAGSGAPYFSEAIRLYNELLELRRTSAVGTPADDAEVLYQLSRAMEGAGRADEALGTLDTLVAEYPAGRHQDEAEFRRGETYFVRRDYVAAERAYAAVLAMGDGSSFHEQALYKQGWALFKQGRNEDGLRSFLHLIDRKLGGTGSTRDRLDAMGRA